MKASEKVDTGTVERLCGTDVGHCYQCGKCSAGCPVADRMDLLPHQVLRLVQLGRVDRAMACEAVWQCVSCLTCTTRCPQSVGCAAVFDALRQLSIAHGVASPARQRVVAFHQAFLENVRRYGRLHELDLVRRFKTRVFFRERSVPFLLKDATLASRMLRRGKLHLTSNKVKDVGIVERIFQRCESPD